MGKISGYGRELVILIRAMEHVISTSPRYVLEINKVVDFEYLKWVGEDLELDLSFPLPMFLGDNFILAIDRLFPKNGIFKNLKINYSEDALDYYETFIRIDTHDINIFLPSQDLIIDEISEKKLFTRILFTICKNLLKVFYLHHGKKNTTRGYPIVLNIHRLKIVGILRDFKNPGDRAIKFQFQFQFSSPYLHTIKL